MTIDLNKVVSVNYHLTIKGTEEHVEQTSKENPFLFLYGTGGLLPDFENNLKGKKVGDAFDFFIDAVNGYGVRDEQHVVMIPIDAFLGEDGKLDEENVKVGVTLPMVDNEGISARTCTWSTRSSPLIKTTFLKTVDSFINCFYFIPDGSYSETTERIGVQKNLRLHQ